MNNNVAQQVAERAFSTTTIRNLRKRGFELASSGPVPNVDGSWVNAETVYVVRCIADGGTLTTTHRNVCALAGRAR